MKPIEQLALKALQAAVRDYLTARAYQVAHQGTPGQERKLAQAQRTVESCRAFLTGDIAELLLDIPGEQLIRLLERKINEADRGTL